MNLVLDEGRGHILLIQCSQNSFLKLLLLHLKTIVEFNISAKRNFSTWRDIRSVLKEQF